MAAAGPSRVSSGIRHCAVFRSPFKRIGRRRASCDASPLAAAGVDRSMRETVWFAERFRFGGLSIPPDRLQLITRIAAARVDLNFDNARKIAFLGGTEKPRQHGRSPMRKFAAAFTAAAALCAFPAAGHAQTVLKASHQFPGGKGDARDEMVQIIAREAKAANAGLEVQVYPGASLFKPNDQWNAMVNGQLDISSFPLDYASGKVGAFSATLMPALVRNHDRATRLNESPFMKEIKTKIDKAGVVVLADAWLAGAVASKKACIRKPEDIKGLKIRSAGPTFAAMWQQAGASIVSVPSNEVYNALQTGVADATDTSTGSFVSFRIYEQVKCITAPGDNALWFMYEPVLMSKRSFNRLKKEQQDALINGGKKSEDYFNKATKGLDDEMANTFKKNNVEVVTLTPQEFEAWVKIAQESSYKQFAAEVPDGKKLIDEALAVK
jgi:TRAP-type transport system periplasmic protein